jgi:hypothetical protein
LFLHTAKETEPSVSGLKNPRKEKIKKNFLPPQKNERKEMRSAYHSAVYSNNDAATFFGPVSFADAIKSRSHLITTQGEGKTDGTRTLIIIERPTFISFFLSLFLFFPSPTVDEDDTDFLVVTSFYIYNSRQCASMIRPLQLPFRRSGAPIV